MEIGIPENANGNGSATPNNSLNNSNLNLMPVRAEESGEGLPYAPENWPLPGDIWGWRTGRRVAGTGYFLDRYLYLPIRLCRIENAGSNRKKHGFASKLSVGRYIQKHFPDVDMNAFFDLFSWKIPACQSGPINSELLSNFFSLFIWCYLFVFNFFLNFICFRYVVLFSFVK